MFDSLSPGTLSEARAAARLLHSHRRALGIDDIAARLDTLSADLGAELENRERTDARARQAP